MNTLRAFLGKDFSLILVFSSYRTPQFQYQKGCDAIGNKSVSICFSHLTLFTVITPRSKIIIIKVFKHFRCNKSISNHFQYIWCPLKSFCTHLLALILIRNIFHSSIKTTLSCTSWVLC